MNLLADPKTMTEEEREAHIGDCGRLVESEMKAGNREAAMSWLQAMEEAIKTRTPEQVARLEAERGLSEPCYFDTQGEIHRGQLPAFLREQAA